MDVLTRTLIDVFMRYDGDNSFALKWMLEPPMVTQPDRIEPYEFLTEMRDIWIEDKRGNRAHCKNREDLIMKAVDYGISHPFDLSYVVLAFESVEDQAYLVAPSTHDRDIFSIGGLINELIETGENYNPNDPVFVQTSAGHHCSPTHITPGYTGPVIQTTQSNWRPSCPSCTQYTNEPPPGPFNSGVKN